MPDGTIPSSNALLMGTQGKNSRRQSPTAARRCRASRMCWTRVRSRIPDINLVSHQAQPRVRTRKLSSPRVEREQDSFQIWDTRVSCCRIVPSIQVTSRPRGRAHVPPKSGHSDGSGWEISRRRIGHRAPQTYAASFARSFPRIVFPPDLAGKKPTLRTSSSTYSGQASVDTKAHSRGRYLGQPSGRLLWT